MKNVTNRDRANWARDAVKSYAATTGSVGNGSQSDIQDLIGDLRHYCWQRKFDWEVVLQNAYYHYAEEQGLHWKYGGLKACHVCGNETCFEKKNGKRICIECFEGEKLNGNQKRRRRKLPVA